jgi:hypothetical protein
MATFTDDWISRQTLLLFKGVGTLPNPAKFYLCAADTTALTRASTLQDFVNAELKPQFGYNRQQVLWTASGAFSNPNKRYELPTFTVTFTADASGSLQFQTVFLLADAHSKASERFSPANVTGNTVTIAGNLLTNGDSVIPVADVGASLPGGLSSGTKYQVINVNSGTGAFQFSADGATAIALSGTGSGTFRLKYASGSIVLLQVETAPVSLQPGRPCQYDIDIVGMNAAYGAGV